MNKGSKNSLPHHCLFCLEDLIFVIATLYQMTNWLIMAENTETEEQAALKWWNASEAFISQLSYSDQFASQQVQVSCRSFLLSASDLARIRPAVVGRQSQENTAAELGQSFCLFLEDPYTACQFAAKEDNADRFLKFLKQLSIFR